MQFSHLTTRGTCGTVYSWNCLVSDKKIPWEVAHPLLIHWGSNIQCVCCFQIKWIWHVCILHRITWKCHPDSFFRVRYWDHFPVQIMSTLSSLNEYKMTLLLQLPFVYLCKMKLLSVSKRKLKLNNKMMLGFTISWKITESAVSTFSFRYA